jgi:hypothetical protein
MSRPIANTPILSGKDAIRFEEDILNPIPVSREELNRVIKNYNLINKIKERQMLKIPCEIYSRCCGYFRPIAQWNKGKQSEFEDRKNYIVSDIKSESEVTL